MALGHVVGAFLAFSVVARPYCRNVCRLVSWKSLICVFVFFKLALSHSVELFVAWFCEGVLALGFFIGVRPCFRGVCSFCFALALGHVEC